MSVEQQPAAETKEHVSPHVPGDSRVPPWAGKFLPVQASVNNAREFYKRLLQSSNGLRWEKLLPPRRDPGGHSWPAAMRAVLPHLAQPLAPAISSEILAGELASLAADRCLAENADFGVYLVHAGESPNLLQELGRLREVTFRAAGEGTGKARDLDRFDDYYWQVLLWSKTARELVGGYRVGNTAEILQRHGVDGLYTSTLFRYDAQLFEKMGPALEMGRSFVRPEYQRQYAPLLLLWKGIGRMVAARPETPVLFGAVSISNEYSKGSRELIYRYFERRMREDELTAMVEPRRPFRPNPMLRWGSRDMCHAMRNLDELAQPIADLEADGKGVPILLRQYVKIGGKVLGFNVDRNFSNVLDGLVVVDLRQTEAAVLDRYMGREQAGKFRQYHRQCACV